MKQSKKALSLIELITIIIILAIMATVTFVSIQENAPQPEVIISNDTTQEEEEEQENEINITEEKSDIQTVFDTVSVTDDQGILMLNSLTSGEPTIIETENFNLYRGVIDTSKLDIDGDYYYNLIGNKDIQNGFICLEISDTEYTSEKPSVGNFISNCDEEIINNTELDTYIY